MIKFENFEPKLGGWAQYLKPFFDNGEMNKIYEFLKAQSKEGRKICPESTQTFRAFYFTPPEKLKVIFLLQDPYPWMKNNKYVADGIALSCSNTKVLQPSLELFYKGIEEDIYDGLNLYMDKNPDLQFLCEQGIMMLNTSLTVELNKPSSHYEIWQPFTRFFLEEVITNHFKHIIIVFAGKLSQSFEKYINPLQHYVFSIEHPAAAAHKQKPWEHKNIFSKCNKLILELHNTSVSWDSYIPF